MNKMSIKAYRVDTDDGYSKVIFAESRGKAKAIAMHSDFFEDMNFLEIKPYRVRQFDKCYRGLTEMDWEDKYDRIALVMDGWTCHYDINCQPNTCPAKQFCSRYKEERQLDT